MRQSCKTVVILTWFWCVATLSRRPRSTLACCRACGCCFRCCLTDCRFTCWRPAQFDHRQVIDLHVLLSTMENRRVRAVPWSTYCIRAVNNHLFSVAFATRTSSAPAEDRRDVRRFCCASKRLFAAAAPKKRVSSGSPKALQRLLASVDLEGSKVGYN
jgi:hypothetical protein